MSHRMHVALPQFMRSRRTIAILLIGVGLLIFVGSTDLVNSAVWNVLWPLALIGVGLDLVTEGRQRRRVIAGTLLAALLVVPVAGMAGLFEQESAEQPVSESRPVPPLEDIQRLQATISLTGGQLSIRDLDDSTEDVVDLGGDGVINSYTRDGETGMLNIGGRSGEEQDLDLRFRPDLPLDLTIVTGSGNAQPLDFEELRLERLNLNVGTGEAEITLPEEGPIDATITSLYGGRVEIEIPDELSTRIEIAASLSNVEIDERFQHQGNAYVSDDYDPNAENQALIRINGTAGNISVR